MYLAAVTRSRESKKLKYEISLISTKLVRNSTHNPDASSNLTFCFPSSSWIIGLFQICIISCAHACNMAPGSSGSSQSTPSSLSKLVRSDLMSRLKAFFQGVVELMAISLNTCFEGALSCVASVSPDPAIVKRRIRFCSTWMRGSNRDLILKSSKVCCDRRFWALRDVEDSGTSSGFWIWEIASRMVRKDWTTFNWITALHDARSSRNDYGRFINPLQAKYTLSKPNLLLGHT